jgi:hypothetical protein
MQNFEFFIEDDRYTVPTLEIVLVRDAARARELAADRLLSSFHHLSVEVRQGGLHSFRLARSARGDADIAGPEV